MRKINAVLVVTVLSLLAYSCKKPGCTDPEATNYEAKAKSNNLLCTYEGSLLLWYTEKTADSLAAFTNSDTLKFYVENVYVDSISLDEFNVQEPQCGAKSAATYNASLKRSDFRWVKYHVRNETGALLYDSIVQMTANNCKKIRLQ